MEVREVWPIIGYHLPELTDQWYEDRVSGK